MKFNGLLRLLLLTLVVVAFQGTRVLAGTTGSIQGFVTDSSGHAIAGAAVTATSPSQNVRGVTDSKGFYSLLNLSPDTYAVTAAKDGFDPTTVYGITVQADQLTRSDLSLRISAKVIGHVTATAETSVVNKTVTGDLYAVNAQALNSYAGSSGGSETLYSQNGVVGSLPGVVRTVGSGGGYFGQGTLSIRGGAYDQVGFELDGVPLNRGFDFYNSTSFLTNGLSSLEVYTGGEPADSGRAMSGYINQVIRRGAYPGGADFTAVVGGPTFNHTVNMDIFGGTPDQHFTYYVSTLAVNSGYSFNNRQNDGGYSFTVPANDPGCTDFTAIQAGGGVPTPITCTQANTLSAPLSQGSYASTVYAADRDTVTNLNWTFGHGGLQDNLQALYVVGSTVTPNFQQYSGPNVDPRLYCEEAFCNFTATGQVAWPVGALYLGHVNQAFQPNNFLTLTWPSSGGSTGAVPASYTDGQNTQYSIEKLGYTRSLTSSSFLRLYGYQLFSAWTLDQATEATVGGTYYQLHDNALGITANYQNQLNAQHLLKVDVDYTKDLTLRYNYWNAYHQPNPNEPGGHVLCFVSGTTFTPSNVTGCTAASQTVASIRGPYAYWSSTTPITDDAVIQDTFKPSDRFTFDVGVRFDQFKFALMPLQITGANGLAEQAQNQYGVCLHGYNYGPSEPCNAWDSALGGVDAPGQAHWTNASGDLTFNTFSPRFGVTFTATPRDVIRFSVGRYVQPPDSAFEEYRAAPFWGAGNTVGILNRYYDGLGFLAVHNVQPEDSTNYDLSFEHDFANGLSAKVTPFYRNTRGQILNLPVNPLQPTFVTGYNFGAARISGLEFLVAKNRTTSEGLSGTLSATYTDAKIRFYKNAQGLSYIDQANGVLSNGQCPPAATVGICGYNAQHGTHYALLDPNGYYYPSYTQSPLVTSPSYTVPFVMTLTLDERTHGFDLSPSFNYQSGNPYGDPSLFPDPTGAVNIGPDPYTHTFDAPGSLSGPSWLSMNMSIAHDLGSNAKATFLVTNVFTSIHNHGYAWEQPTGQGAISYGDNTNYQLVPLGYAGLTGFPNTSAYYGDNYYPYAPAGIIPAREYVFSVSTKL